jgi:hypothetical protein
MQVEMKERIPIMMVSLVHTCVCTHYTRPIKQAGSLSTPAASTGPPAVRFSIWLLMLGLGGPIVGIQICCSLFC